MTELRAAVVGVGHLGRYHAEKYVALAGVRLVGVVDSDPTRAHEVAMALGVPVFPDHHALAGLVDCASVAVPTGDHATVGLDLLAAGIDVLIEKPLASTVAEGAALVRAAAAGGRILQVGHLERFKPGVAGRRGRDHGAAVPGVPSSCSVHRSRDRCRRYP